MPKFDTNGNARPQAAGTSIAPRRWALLAMAGAWCIAHACLMPAQTAGPLATPAASALEAGFRTPPPSAHPWVYWMWLRVQTNHAAITEDLQEMHAKGIEGAILYDSGVGGRMEADSRMVLGTGADGRQGYQRVRTGDYRDAHFTPIPLPPMASWTPQSNELVRFAAGEAARIGVKLVVTVGLASTSGNIPLRYGQQRLQWSELAVSGPSNFSGKLPEALTPVSRGENKTSAGSFINRDPDARPSADSHDVAVLAVPDKPQFDPAEVVRLQALPDAAGNVRWAVPAGKWKLLRFAYAPTGKTNAWGLFTDAMSDEALDATWQATLAPVLQGMSAEQRHGLYGIEDDSWEAGQSTWTKQFAEEFRQLRGYDLLPWLPVLAGMPIGTAAQREGVARDFDRTVADLIAEHHYARLNELARQNDLVLYAEAAGPNSGQLDPLRNSGQVDVPVGEFWMPSQHRATLDRRFLARDAANGAHVYGKPLVACEALTSVGPFWEETFLDMKITADQGIAEGCNRLAIHNYSHSPSLSAKPGYVYFAGTFYDRTVTWWQQTPAFNAYLGRNQWLLRQGLFVADALYYRGDGIGQIEQRKTIPALPAPGYDHDNANLDVLLHRLSVQNGRLVLPDGMSYRMLVLADQPNDAPMPLDALRKLRQLVLHGAVVVGPRPRSLAGLVRNAADTQEFDRIASQLWPDGDPRTAAGRVWNVPAAQALSALRLPPDLTYTGLSPDGEIDWIHRRAGTTDIYLVASRWDKPETITATFRVAGRQPELWDPVSGAVRDAHAFRQHDGLTQVPLQLDPRGSVYVVFRKPISADASGTAASNYPAITPVRTLDGPWQVSFDPKWGGPPSATFDALTDWTKRPEEGIRYYSGTAVYRQTLQLPSLPEKGEHLLLNLGVVHEEASVTLNGVDLGVVWTKPARVDITSAARVGQNQLAITVVNLWPNRLIGDESLPEAARFTSTNAHKFSAATPLLPSGLLGPVTLERQSEDPSR